MHPSEAPNGMNLFRGNTSNNLSNRYPLHARRRNYPSGPDYYQPTITSTSSRSQRQSFSSREGLFNESRQAPSLQYQPQSSFARGGYQSRPRSSPFQQRICAPNIAKSNESLRRDDRVRPNQASLIYVKRQDCRMPRQQHYSDIQSSSRSRQPTNRTSFPIHGSYAERFNKPYNNSIINDDREKNQSHRERWIQGGNENNDNDNTHAQSLCRRRDYDCNATWSIIRVKNLDLAHKREQTLFVSDSEPVIVFQRHLMSLLPHSHISDPFYINPHQVGRKIKPVPIPKDISSTENDFNFSVLSYNILSDRLLKENIRLYSGYPEWLLDWEYRKNNLLKEVINYNADIICLQEVENDAMDSFFIPKLKEKGYHGVFKKRTGNKSDGCAIFYRKNRFDCIECRLLEYRIEGHPVMDRDNVGMVLKLSTKHDPKSQRPPLLIANTHLLFNKNRGDIKLLQIASLLAEIEELARVEPPVDGKAANENMHYPVIICGDFNSVPFSPLYNFLVKGRLRYDVLSKKHISGQNSPQKLMNESSYLGESLIPEDLGISSLCQKKNDRTLETCDSIYADSRCSENNDCYIVEQKIGGRKVIMEEPGILKHLLRFQSAYSHKLEDGHAEVTTCHSEVSTCVDYILFSQGLSQVYSKSLDSEDDIFMNITRKQLYLTSLLALLGGSDISAMGKLPNIYLSSDHLCLFASFKLLE